ncbi:MAG: hypothetical protein ACXWDM_12310 [Nocardioides sp.]
MMLRATAVLLDQHGLITHRQARAAGLSDREVRSLLARRVWVSMRRGVYVDEAHWASLDPFREQPLLRVHAARLTLRSPWLVFSHDSASLVHGMGVPDAARALVHVTHHKVHGDAVRAGVKHHLAPYAPEQVLWVAGLPVLDPARTALDMAREHGLMTGVASCDRALRLGNNRSELHEARAAMWCWPGSRTMDEAIELADPGAESWLESTGRVLVHSLGRGRPQTQFGLTDGHRSVWCDMRLGRHIFECDGDLKYDEDNLTGLPPRTVLRHEKERQDFISGFKLGVSRITAHDTGPGARVALQRLGREYDDTCARFGTDITDLAPYIVRGPRR